MSHSLPAAIISNEKSFHLNHGSYVQCIFILLFLIFFLYLWFSAIWVQLNWAQPSCLEFTEIFGSVNLSLNSKFVRFSAIIPLNILNAHFSLLSLWDSSYTHIRSFKKKNSMGPCVHEALFHFFPVLFPLVFQTGFFFLFSSSLLTILYFPLYYQAHSGIFNIRYIVFFSFSIYSF